MPSAISAIVTSACSARQAAIFVRWVALDDRPHEGPRLSRPGVGPFDPVKPGPDLRILAIWPSRIYGIVKTGRSIPRFGGTLRSGTEVGATGHRYRRRLSYRWRTRCVKIVLW